MKNKKTIITTVSLLITALFIGTSFTPINAAEAVTDPLLDGEESMSTEQSGQSEPIQYDPLTPEVPGCIQLVGQAAVEFIEEGIENLKEGISDIIQLIAGLFTEPPIVTIDDIVGMLPSITSFKTIVERLLTNVYNFGVDTVNLVLEVIDSITSSQWFNSMVEISGLIIEKMGIVLDTYVENHYNGNYILFLADLSYKVAMGAITIGAWFTTNILIPAGVLILANLEEIISTLVIIWEDYVGPFLDWLCITIFGDDCEEENELLLEEEAVSGTSSSSTSSSICLTCGTSTSFSSGDRLSAR